MDKKRPLKIRITSAMASPETAHFLTILPLFKMIDDTLDKIPAEQWSEKFGEVRLGDAASPFLDNVLESEGVKARLQKYNEAYGQIPADLMEVCNLLCLQLKEIGDLTRDVRTEDTVATRRALAKGHERLSILALTCGSFPASELAPIIRNTRKEQGDTLAPIYEALTAQREVQIDKKHRYSVRAFGAMQQAVDDANDFVADLRTEVEHERITPNRFMADIRESGATPKEFFTRLLRTNSEDIRKNRPIPGKALGDMQHTIKDELLKHAGIINDLRVGFAARGFYTDASEFPTKSVDHTKDQKQSGKLTGDAGWAGRARALKNTEKALGA